MMQVLIIILSFYFVSFAQTKDANEIICIVKNKLEKVDDYQVEVNINVDMEFLRIPSVSARIFFKKPDLMKIESEDFAIIPKEAISFSPTKFLNNNYQAIYIKSDSLNDYAVEIIKIIPRQDSLDIVLSSLWIDKNDYLIRKIETTTKNRGTFIANLNFNEMAEFGLPSKVVFTFNISGSQILDLPSREIKGNSKSTVKQNKNISKIINIEYSNYLVNM
jgi:outer membrane lipoprotein-sorting protein